MATTTTQERLIGDGDDNPQAADGSIELEVSAPKGPAKPMNANERAEHGVGANIGRFAYLLLISFAIIVAVVGGWFYFYQ